METQTTCCGSVAGIPGDFAPRLHRGQTRDAVDFFFLGQAIRVTSDVSLEELTMKKLSVRLSSDLIQRGNLPISAEGIMRLRPEIASDVAEAQSVLGNEVGYDQTDSFGDPVQSKEDDFLLARFVAGPDRSEHLHLFMMEAPDAENEGDRILRWSKRPVSYGSFVQIRKYLREAWGEVANLEIERAQLQLHR